jgi:putative SOS response-associated peptidase YedK
MCGRYSSSRPPELIARVFGTVNELPNFPANYNLAPSQLAPLVRLHPDTGERHLDLLRWGLLPYWTKDPKQARRPINAKAETIASSGMFRDAFSRRPALVPAAAFYEWRPIEGQKAKQPYAVARADATPLALAGIWEGWRAPSGEVERTFPIITTAANEMMAPVHDRMPVAIEAADWPLWLGEAEGDAAALLRPATEDVLRLWPVGSRVNATRNNDADLLDQIEVVDAH